MSLRSLRQQEEDIYENALRAKEIEDMVVEEIIETDCLAFIV